MTVRLRSAGSDDCELLFRWVNAPDSLAGKLLTTCPIAWDDHTAWFSAKLNDPDTRIEIIVSGGIDVGQVRFTWRDDAYDIDIYVAPSYRGNGIASEALASAIENAGNAKNGRSVFRALIKNDNRNSVKFFERLGFSCAGRSTDHMIYMYIFKSESGIA